MEHVFIRKAELDDAPMIADLSNQLGYQSTVEQAENRLTTILNSEDHAVLLVCLSDGEVVGWIHTFLSFRVESDCFAEIGGLVVLSLYQNSGFGKKLIAAAEEWTIQKGINKLRVRSRCDRSDALAFYKQQGFSKTKLQQVFDKDLK